MSKIVMVNCNLCNSYENEHLYTKNGFIIVKCKKCGLVFVKNQPSSFELQNKYYDKYYFKGKIYKDYECERNQRIIRFKEKIRFINKLYPQKGKILDIGCAMGFFIEVANAFGWCAYGVEISEYATYLAKRRGLKIFFGDFCYLNFDDYIKYFDVVNLSDVIEHLKDPKGALLKINKIMKENGLIVISTGNIDSIDGKVSKDEWDLLVPPYHLYYFSKNTIIKLLEITGFKLIKIKSKEGNVLSQTGLKKFIKLEIKQNLLNVLNYYLLKLFNGDIMTIYAKKINNKH